MDHQFTLPSSNMTCFSNVSAQAQQLVNGLNNITLNSYDNTITFNNTTISIDKSIIMDLINNLLANIKSIYFQDDSFISGINNGYVFDENDELVLDYNPNIALSTVFGYQIKNQADVINTNLETEIYTRQQSDKTIIDQLIISNKNCETVQAMLAYMVFDRTQKQMIIFIPVPKQDPPVGINTIGHMDNLPGENLIDETDNGSHKPLNPKEGINEKPTEEYENKIVGVFDENGFTADAIMSETIINKELFNQTIYFTDSQLQPHSILKGLDINMTDININNIDTSDLSKNDCLTRAPCSFLLKDNLNKLYYRNFLNSCYFDMMQTSKGSYETRTFQYNDPYNPDLKPSNIKLNLDSSGWGIWEAIKDVQDTINEWNGDNYYMSRLKQCFNYSDRTQGSWTNAWKSFWCDYALQITQPHYKTFPGNMPYDERYPTLTIWGNLEVVGDIYVSKNEDKDKEHHIKRMHHYHENPKETYDLEYATLDHVSTKMATDYFDTTYKPVIQNNANEIVNLKTIISTLTDSNTALTESNTALKNELEEVKTMTTNWYDSMMTHINDLQNQINLLKK